MKLSVALLHDVHSFGISSSLRVLTSVLRFCLKKTPVCTKNDIPKRKIEYFMF